MSIDLELLFWTAIPIILYCILLIIAIYHAAHTTHRKKLRNLKRIAIFCVIIVIIMNVKVSYLLNNVRQEKTLKRITIATFIMSFFMFHKYIQYIWMILIIRSIFFYLPGAIFALVAKA